MKTIKPRRSPHSKYRVVSTWNDQPVWRQPWIGAARSGGKSQRVAEVVERVNKQRDDEHELLGLIKADADLSTIERRVAAAVVYGPAPDVVIPPHVLGLYRGPFRENYGFVYDADGNTVADFHGEIDGGPRQSFRPRGWGRLQYFKDGEKLHDDAERVLLAIVANHPCDVGACLDAINDAWLRALVEKQPRTPPEKR